MVKLKSICTLLIGAFISAGALAQDGKREGEDVVYCTQHVHEASFLAANPEKAEAIAKLNDQLEKETQEFIRQGGLKAGENIVIPLVFHILHDDGAENISDEQIFDQMRILNEDYNKLNPDTASVIPEFKDIIADVGVTFRLATLDPDGNCTNGIIRYKTLETYDAGEGVKGGRAWPTDQYLNIYTATYIGGAAGYAYLPATAAFMGDRDGIMILHNYVGSIGTGNLNRSRALTHEIGHWANLNHPWGGSNNPTLPDNCNSDDNVADTPNTIGWDRCDLSGATCGSLDNVQNFMDYSYCSNMFTEGQADRLIAALNSSTAGRNNLWTEENLIATGTNDNALIDLCSVEIAHEGLTRFCTGQSISFTDNSYHTVTSREWSFPGGTPATSTDKNVTVTYNQAGTYSVSLTVYNENGSLTDTWEHEVDVLASDNLIGGISENFAEVTSIEEDVRFNVENPDEDNTWEISTSAGYDDNKCIFIDNRSNGSGKVDNFIIGNFDMSAETDLVIDFKYAYAPRSSSSNDQIKVFVSNDCGANWSLRKRIKGDKLETAPAQNSFFTPSDASEWALSEQITVSSSYHSANVQIKLEWTSGNGNNIYVDDINFYSGTGIAELGLVNDVSVYPNPSSDKIQISFQDLRGTSTEFVLMDLAGRVVNSSSIKTQFGDNTHTMNVAGLESGVYVLNIVQNNQTMNFQKVIVE